MKALALKGFPKVGYKEELFTPPTSGALINPLAITNFLISLAHYQLPMNTTYIPPQDSLERQWYVVDATDQRLGRLASEIAIRLRGKNKPTYTPHLDTGDFVIVVNAEKIVVTGKKRTQKVYLRHSGRPGGMKTETFAKLQARLPERIIEEAVRGMLPKNSLGRQLFTKLKVYAGPSHPHQAQKPEQLTINTIPGE